MTSVGVDLCQHLEWDSSFFGKRIARVAADRLSPETAVRLRRECLAGPIDCVYLLADVADRETIRIAEGLGFVLVDIRVTLERAAGRQPESTTLPHHSVRPFRSDDLPALRAIARAAHRDSRFYQDGHFQRERCDDLFEQWIVNCCTGTTEKVFVAEQGGQICGYTSSDIRPDGTGQLGLVAVEESHQGAGIGRLLVNTAVQWFERETNVARIFVVTQGRNLRAQRLYQRCGFLTSALQLWFHGWLLEAAASSHS